MLRRQGVARVLPGAQTKGSTCAVKTTGNVPVNACGVQSRGSTCAVQICLDQAWG